MGRCFYKLINKRASAHSTTKNYFIMKAYQKAEMIAKNLPTGSYAAGCPTGTRYGDITFQRPDGRYGTACSFCELAQ